jgi:hypothetical protein
MQYAMLIYHNEAANMQMNEQEQGALMVAYNAFTTEMQQNGAMRSGEALMPTTNATTVRVRQGKILTTDGPFAETKEQLGGFYLLDCKDLDEAIAMAAKIPDANNGSIEIRPVVVWE